MRSKATQAELGGVLFHRVPDRSLGDALTPTLPGSADELNSLPPLSSAARTHASTVALTQSGIGTVLMCPPLPTRWTIAQCSSRCCKCVNSRSANSRLRRPQPSSTANIARSRLPLSVLGSGACQNLRARSALSQFPSLTPNFLAPFSRRMPAASSGLNRPASAAS